MSDSIKRYFPLIKMVNSKINMYYPNNLTTVLRNSSLNDFEIIIKTDSFHSSKTDSIIFEKNDKSSRINSILLEKIRFYFREYDGFNLLTMTASTNRKSPIIKDIYDELFSGVEFPSSRFIDILDRYEETTAKFDYFSGFKKRFIPQSIDDMFVKKTDGKQTKDLKVGQAHYSQMGKSENMRKSSMNSSSSYSPIKADLKIGFTDKDNFIPIVLFTLPILSSNKYKMPVPILSNNFENFLEQSFEKFEAAFKKCIINIIANKENLKLKEKKLLFNLSDEELYMRYKIVEMINI